MENHFPKIGNVDVDWNDLKYALTVARCGGLSHAAKLLGTSASTVSRHIQQLENNLGQTLFLRHQSGYLLTDQGKEVLDLIGGVEQALLALDRRDKPDTEMERLTGLIRVACAEMVASHLIVPRLPELYRAHPDLRVELVVDLRMADLNRREADLAVRLITPGNKVTDRDYIAHMVGKVVYSAYRSAHHELGDRYVTWGQEWAHLPAAEWLAQQFGSQSARLCVDSANAQLQAVRHGIGVAVLPRYVGDAEPGLCAVDISKDQIVREFWLMYHRDLKASRRVQVMRDFLTGWIQDVVVVQVAA